MSTEAEKWEAALAGLKMVKEKLIKLQKRQEKFVTYILTLCSCGQGQHLDLYEKNYVYCDHCEFLIGTGDMKRKEV